MLMSFFSCTLCFEELNFHATIFSMFKSIGYLILSQSGLFKFLVSLAEAPLVNLQMNM